MGRITPSSPPHPGCYRDSLQSRKLQIQIDSPWMLFWGAGLCKSCRVASSLSRCRWTEPMPSMALTSVEEAFFATMMMIIINSLVSGARYPRGNPQVPPRCSAVRLGSTTRPNVTVSVRRQSENKIKGIWLMRRHEENISAPPHPYPSPLAPPDPATRNPSENP